MTDGRQTAAEGETGTVILISVFLINNFWTSTARLLFYFLTL